MSNVATIARRSRVQVTAAEASQLLDYCAETGVIKWRRNRRGGARAGDVAGARTSSGYIQIHLNGQIYFAHRLAWLLFHGTWPACVIDHIDGDGTNNRIANLRDVSIQVNQHNQRRAHRSNRSSGLLGAHFDSRTGRWLAKITVSNRTVNLGRYDTAQQAHEAYLQQKRIIHIGASA